MNRPRHCIFECVRFGEPAFWRDTLGRDVKPPNSVGSNDGVGPF